MTCPVCEGRLRAVTKHGVEVDICPDCKGVWLDRGELDKILDMVEQGGPAVEQSREEEPRRPAESRERERDERHRDRDERYSERDEPRHHDRERPTDHRGHRPHRRESFLSQIFNAFGGGDD